MANDREQELQRLEKELLAGITEDDDLLTDIPIELLDTAPISWEDIEPMPEEDSLEITPEDLMDYPQEPVEPMKKTTSKKEKTAKKREDQYVTVLMAIASFLSLGIIGVLIYWLEVFFG